MKVIVTDKMRRRIHSVQMELVKHCMETKLGATLLLTHRRIG